MHTDHSISSRKPDNVLINKKRKPDYLLMNKKKINCHLEDFVVSADNREKNERKVTTEKNTFISPEGDSDSYRSWNPRNSPLATEHSLGKLEIRGRMKDLGRIESIHITAL